MGRQVPLNPSFKKVLVTFRYLILPLDSKIKFPRFLKAFWNSWWNGSTLILFFRVLRIDFKILSLQFSHSFMFWLFVIPCMAARQASLSITNSWSFLKLIHRVGDAIQPSDHLSSPSLPAFNLSQHQGLFKWVSFLNHVAKVLKLQLQHQSFQWIFRTDLDLLAWSPCSPRNSQESYPTPQFKSINFWAFGLLYVQPSHPYMTTERIIALTRWTFVGKVLSLLFNMLSRFVTVFLQRSIF